MTKKGEVIIYKSEDGKSHLEVNFEDETVWLSQAQMSELFRQTKQNISLHINNIFKEKELFKKSVVKESLTTAKDGKQYKTLFYNLDVIISVGYRVKSIRGTQFRMWATKLLKDHLVKGHTINEARLKQNQQQLQELQHTIELIQSSIDRKQLSVDEANGLLNIITNYTRSFILLNQYDTQTLETPFLTKKIFHEIAYEEARNAIGQLKKELISKKEATDLFGKQKDESFQSLLQSVVQTFGGQLL